MKYFHKEKRGKVNEILTYKAFERCKAEEAKVPKQTKRMMCIQSKNSLPLQML